MQSLAQFHAFVGLALCKQHARQRDFHVSSSLPTRTTQRFLSSLQLANFLVCKAEAQTVIGTKGRGVRQRTKNSPRFGRASPTKQCQGNVGLRQRGICGCSIVRSARNASANRDWATSCRAPSIRESTDVPSDCGESIVMSG